jgi:hypothetical protein
VEIDAPLPDVEVEARVSNAPTESRHAILKSPNPGNTLTYDPLVRLVEVAAIQGGPFRIDQQQFPSPLLFESEDLSETTVQLSATSAPAPDGGTPHGMVLRSTILGVKQRAALINARLCFEGSEFHVNGERYLLRSVYPRKVVLFRGTELIELAIPAEIAGDSSTSAREPRKLPTDSTWDD